MRPLWIIFWHLFNTGSYGCSFQCKKLCISESYERILMKKLSELQVKVYLTWICFQDDLIFSSIFSQGLKGRAAGDLNDRTWIKFEKFIIKINCENVDRQIHKSVTNTCKWRITILASRIMKFKMQIYT